MSKKLAAPFGAMMLFAYSPAIAEEPVTCDTPGAELPYCKVAGNLEVPGKLKVKNGIEVSAPTGGTQPTTALHITTGAGENDRGIVIDMTPGALSGLDVQQRNFIINKPATPGNFMRFINPDGRPVTQIADGGQYESAAWLLISGNIRDVGSNRYFVPPTSRPYMIGAYSDILGPTAVFRSNQYSDGEDSWPLSLISGAGRERMRVGDNGDILLGDIAADPHVPGEVLQLRLRRFGETGFQVVGNRSEGGPGYFITEAGGYYAGLGSSGTEVPMLRLGTGDRTEVTGGAGGIGLFGGTGGVRIEGTVTLAGASRDALGTAGTGALAYCSDCGPSGQVVVGTDGSWQALATGEQVQVVADAAATAAGKADAAQADATRALDNAASAQTAADEAQRRADAAQQATTTLVAAQKATDDIARGAATAAADARTAADAAQATADTALSKAEALEKASTQTNGAVSTAQNTADAAQAKATTALSAANKAQGTADVALDEARTAQSDATRALGEIGKLKTAGGAAQATADAALTAAGKAQTTADTASKQAQAAGTTAGDAKAKAEAISGDLSDMGVSRQASASGIAVGGAATSNKGGVSIGNRAKSLAGAVAVGEEASAGDGPSVAVGSGATAANNSAAYGADSVATGYAATATGGFARAYGEFGTAAGFASSVYGKNGTAVGANATSAGDNATALGANAVAQGTGTTALGADSVAKHAGATAVGLGAATTRDKQVVLGGKDSSVTVGDVAASTAAQSGTVYYATVDENGTLGRGSAVGQGQRATAVLESAAAANSLAMQSALDAQEAALTGLQGSVNQLFDLSEVNRRDADRANEGVAMALAMDTPSMGPDSKVAISYGVGYYNRRSAATAAFSARLSERSYVTAGVGVGLRKGQVGARAGMRHEW